MKKINFGKASMIMTVLGGIASLIGGIAGTIDAKQTAIQTAHDTTIEYLDANIKNEESAEA